MTVDAKEYLEKLTGGPLTFGRVLKANRMSEGWSQQELADKIRVSKMTISLFERGKSLPTPENLKAIAKVFKMPVESFLRYVLQDYAAKHGDFDVEIKARDAG
jgi:transcriptional regulator with XRE-family HTH domain